MSRAARFIMEGGYQHIIIRGTGRQILFEDDNDYRYFIKLLRQCSEETEIKVAAYCLMDNHVHLLIRDSNLNTSLFMKKLCISYAGYYNRKYDRVGHLFQDRYKNENVNDEKYYLTVLRYILRNPANAGICMADKYRWSSFSLYYSSDSFIEQKLIRELFQDESAFRAYVSTPTDDICMEYEFKRDDEWAKKKLQAVLGNDSGMALQNMDIKSRDESLRKLKTAGMSVRQIARLTGINRGVVQKATKGVKKNRPQ